MAYFTTSTQLKIYYEDYGDQGPPLILLHGLASSTHIWDTQYPELSESFRVFAMDFPGHGKSDSAERYSFSLLTEVLFEFIEHLQLEKTALAGLSVGCIVALSVAVQHPDKVSHLILEGPVGSYSRPHSLYHLLDEIVFRTFPILLLVAISLFGYDRTVHFIDTYGVKTDANFTLLESLQKEADRKAIRQLLMESANPPHLEKLPTAQVPTLIIRGENDPMPKRFCTYIQKYIGGPCELATIANVRHIVALEAPSEFNQLVRNFILKPDSGR